MIAPRCPVCGERLSRSPCPAEATEEGGLVTVDWPMACEECMRGFVLRARCPVAMAFIMDESCSNYISEIQVTAEAHRPHRKV